MAYQGVDFYDITSMLTEEERLVQETIRSFVSENIIPIVTRHNREGSFPMGIIPKLGNLGVFGANLQGYGCAGMNNVAYGLIMQELERGDSGIRSFVSVQGALVMYPIYAYGNPAQKERWLPAMARGEKIGCFGLTEPDFGSDPSGMRTKAVVKRDGFCLNGTKMWITNGSIADVSIIWAKTDEGIIRGFLVEKDRPGFFTRDVEGKFSMRVSVTSEIVLEDCWIPSENVLPGTHGLKSPLGCLTQARTGIAWGAIGAAMACYDETLRYAKNRIQFDKPIASFQLVQERFAWMLTEITKAQLLALQLSRLKDQGKMTYAQVSMAKRNNVAIALDIARACRDILGANGISDEYHVGRHMCNLETVKTYEGTHNIHTLILGKEITGIPAFS